MSLDRIRKTIREQAEAEAERVRRDAEAKAEEITRAARDESAAERDGAIEQTKASCAEQAGRSRSRLETEMRMAVLRAKSDLIAQAFDRALAKARALPESEYLDVMATWLATAGAEGRAGEIVVNERDLALMAGAFMKRVNAERPKEQALSLAAEPGHMQGGFILRAEGFVIDVTVESQIELLREDMLTEVAEALFG